MYDKYASIPPAFAAFTGFTVITTVHICLFWPFRAWHFWGMYIGLLSKRTIFGIAYLFLTYT
jgi:hypothetical protein